MPLVTAAIPVYNHEKFVAESIRSVINQTYRNIELIVLNDGSKDSSH
jgi:alpha-1,3-rhamnosyltransferase